MANYVINVIISLLSVVYIHSDELGNVEETIQLPVERFRDETLMCSVDPALANQATVHWSKVLEDGSEKQVSRGSRNIAPYVDILKPNANDWNLRIRNITQKREGVYICRSEIIGMTEERARYNISVIPDRNHDEIDKPATLVIKTQPGIEIEMKCLVTDYEADTREISWYKRVKGDLTETLISRNTTTYINTADVQHTDDKWILTIEVVDKSYEGIYVCKVADTELAIYDVIVENIRQVKPLFHQKASLICILPGTITAIQRQRIRWKYNDVILNTFGSKYSLINRFDSNTLVVNRVSPTDSDGIYECVLDNVPFEDCRFEVQVLKGTTIETELCTKKLLTIRENENANLTCIMSGRPEPEITWYRGEQWDVTKVTGNTLIIPETPRYASGQYICYGRNTIKGVEYRKNWTISLTVNFGPEIDVLDEEVITSVTQNVALSCLVQASPKPVMKWYRIGKLGELNSTFEYNTQTPEQIENYPAYTMKLILRSKDSIESVFTGEYKCQATVGGITAERTITVKAPKKEADVDVVTYPLP